MVAFSQVPYLVPTQTESKQTLTDLFEFMSLQA